MEISQYKPISLAIFVQLWFTSTGCLELKSFVMFETVQRPINESIVTDIEQAESLLHCAYKCQRRSSESLYFNDLDQTCYCNNDTDTNATHDPDESPIVYGGYKRSHEPTRSTEISITEMTLSTSALTSPTPSFTTSELALSRYEDCAQLFEAGYEESKEYPIYIRQLNRSVIARCFMAWSSDGPLTLIQYRNAGSSFGFYHNWSQYVSGFSDTEGYDDYWLGLENIAAITNTQQYGLDIYMFPEETWYRSYPADIQFKFDKFSLNPEDNYRMTLSGPRGDNECLPDYNATYFGAGQEFLTFDRDNDLNNTTNCAEMLRSAWWFKDCGFEMNGPFINDTTRAPFMTFPPCWGSDVKLTNTQMGIFKRKGRK